MAKRPKVPLNVLVVESTRQAVKDLAIELECSQGEVIDRALLAFDRGAVNAGRNPDMAYSENGYELNGLPIPPSATLNISNLRNATGARAAGHAKKPSKKEAVIQERAASDVIARSTERDDIDYSDVESTPTTHVANLDATGPPAAAGRGKVSMETWRANRKPINKPGDRKK